MTTTTRFQPTLSGAQHRFAVLFSICAFSLVWCEPASAVILSFENITGNSVQSAADGESQLFVEALDVAGDASFRFFNIGPANSNLAEIYFDDGSLLGISTISEIPPVDFELEASPPNLPGSNNISPAFQVTAGFLAQAVDPAPKNGVGPGEEVTIIFDLKSSQTFQDVLDELTDGRLRIGVHVIGFSNGQSESFVNTAIPEPAAMSLLLLGVAGALARARWRAI